MTSREHHSFPCASSLAYTDLSPEDLRRLFQEKYPHSRRHSRQAPSTEKKDSATAEDASSTSSPAASESGADTDFEAAAAGIRISKSNILMLGPTGCGELPWTWLLLSLW